MIEIVVPSTDDELMDLALFADRVNESRAIRWAAAPLAGDRIAIIKGEGAGSIGRTARPFLAKVDGEIVARAVAIVDQRYIDHWNERLGHVSMFESLPGARDAVRQLMDAACSWLREQGMEAARCGFGPGLDFPFVVDDYETLPPMILRHNPPGYHSLLKDAGFETEQGWVDYKIEVSAELIARWEGELRGVAANGYEIVPLSEIDPGVRARTFTEVWNETFANHFGFSPFIHQEIVELLELLGGFGMFETSVVAYKDGEAAGVLWVTPESTMLAVGRDPRPDEKLNFLGIGVLQAHRGRGVNTAMASYAFLKLANAGAGYLSYTLVLDDNWPSRRTGEKLGGTVCANYVTYRRNFRPRPA